MKRIAAALFSLLLWAGSARAQSTLTPNVNLQIPSYQQTIDANGTLQTQRPSLNLISGSDVTDATLCGSNPYVDIRCYGARSGAASATPGLITASCTSRSPKITISTASDFVNGDWVTIYGCGIPITMSTPSAPTVAPSQSMLGTQTGYVVHAPKGSTNYSYVIIARDQNGGLTAASAAGTTSTGSASLGAQTVSISSLTRSNNVVTLTTSRNHGLSVGTYVTIYQVSDGTFSGSYQVASVPSSTTFTYQQGYDTRYGATMSATGGTVEYWNCNHITWTAVPGAWQYYIYGRTSGRYTLLGANWPGTNTYATLWFDDYGTKMETGTMLPYFVPTTPPSSSLSDPLTAKISSGAGTTRLVLNASASTTTSGQTIVEDSGPAITASINAKKGAVMIPNGGFAVNSFQNWSYFSAISQFGSISLNDTIIPPRIWNGQPLTVWPGAAQFSWGGGAAVGVDRAWPAIYMPNGTHFKGLSFRMNNKNSLVMLVDGGLNVNIEDSDCGENGGNVYLSQCFVSKGIFSYNGSWFNFKGFTAVTSQTTGTATPIIFCQFCGQTRIERLNLSGRGVMVQGTTALEWDHGRIQGGNMPVLIAADGATVIWTNYEEDTTAMPSLDILDTVNPALAPTGGAYLMNVGNPSYDGVSVPGNISGQSSNYVLTVVDGNGSGTSLGTNIGGFAGGAVRSPIIQSYGLGTLGYSFPLPLPAPTVTASAHGSCSSNCVASGTWYYGIIGADIYNNYSGVSYPASITVDGTQTVTVSWIPVPGQVKTYRGRGTSASRIVFSDPYGPAYGSAGTSYTDGTNEPVGAGFFYSASGWPASGANSASLGSLGIAGSQLTITPGRNSGSFTDTLTAPPAGFTANRTVVYPDVSGINVVSGYQNSAYDNFNRANGAVGSNWTVTNGGFNVSSNAVIGTASGGTGRNLAYWNADLFSQSMQFAQARVTTVSNYYGVGAFLSSSGNGYTCLYSTNTLYLSKLSAGANSTLKSVSSTGNAGDVLRIEASPGLINCYKNGTLLLSSSDTTYTSGSPGIYTIGNSATLDNWSGGNLHPLTHLDLEQDWAQIQHFRMNGGTCTMSSSTTCTIQLLQPPPTPDLTRCLVTQQGTGPIIGGECSVSGNTITVTAASSNSATWAAFIF